MTPGAVEVPCVSVLEAFESLRVQSCLAQNAGQGANAHFPVTWDDGSPDSTAILPHELDVATPLARHHRPCSPQFAATC